MTDEDFDRRLRGMAETMELLQGSITDLTAIVHTLAEDTKQRRERDRQYALVLARLFESWAGNGSGK